MINNRQRLINMINGKSTELYRIVYSVDIKRNITILGGSVFEPSTSCLPQTNFLIREEIRIGEHSSFLPEYNILCEMEEEVAATLTHEEIVNAFWEFFKPCPRDGWGCYSIDEETPEAPLRVCKSIENGMEYDRADKEQLQEELIKREREYIKELWGVDLSGYPLDFDFAVEWEQRCEELHRKFGWDRKLTDEEIWGRKIESRPLNG